MDHLKGSCSGSVTFDLMTLVLTSLNTVSFVRINLGANVSNRFYELLNFDRFVEHVIFQLISMYLPN